MRSQRAPEKSRLAAARFVATDGRQSQGCDSHANRTHGVFERLPSTHTDRGGWHGMDIVFLWPAPNEQSMLRATGQLA
ncbi:hypothetical protein EON67_03995 [archaeon]|nr:MAG: hypothetical protein EON67_03995 [archaeon]